MSIQLTAAERRLIERIERAPDFGYDDESAELRERLAARGLRWRWSRDSGPERVIVEVV